MALRLGLTLVTVVAPVPAPGMGRESRETREHQRERVRCAGSYLSEVCRRMEMDRAGLACESKILEEDPASGIVDLARTTEGGMIALTTHGDSGAGRWARGSVADKVVRHAQVPTLVVPSELGFDQA